jgi:endonuclease/exonuclease/phosphatase family metal-dependent hydrolase
MNRLFTRVLFLSAGLLLSSLVLHGCATTRLDSTPAVQSYQIVPDQVPGAADARDGRLRIMTLNVAHGRGDSFHQLLQRSSTTLVNLDAISVLLKDSGADVVALQEADGPSFWSGNFNHIDYLADKGFFSQSVHGVHVDGLGLSYGTALIANLDLRNPKAITFDPSLSPVPKGFVVSAISWPGSPDIDVDIVSVHLDFASRAIRKKQAMELIETLRDRKRPVIIMGDFNAEWHKNSTVQYISQELALSAYKPNGTGLDTFPAFGERLDWILVSPGISFRSYQVVQDAVSDHRGVIAELELDRVALLVGGD